jgi:N-carbamoylputrescine amidase
MSILNVALLQMTACGDDQAANLTKGEAFCRTATRLGADIVLFPEMWNIGYQFYATKEKGSRAKWQTQAVPRDGQFVQHFQRLAAELNIAIAITYLEQRPGGPFNTLSLIDRHGQFCLHYSKVHTCDFSLEAALTPGEGFSVCELDTAAGPVKVGAMICYDREFPESARILMLQEAEIILTPNACELEINRITQFRTRAFENMLGVAMTNYAAPQENGHSLAYDGVAFDRGGSLSMLVVEAGEAEGVYMAPFDLDKMRHYRSHEAWGNAYRKPDRYGLLTSADVHPPFQRRNHKH